jgi:L-ascorbate metabolism protein UlaG (beta-lactamase superfamily)
MARSAEIRRRLRYTSNLLWRSAVTPMGGTHRPPRLVSPDHLGITFIGHSSFLVQAAGRNLLFDPVFTNWLILLRRQRRPGLRIPDLPPIDMVLLSHAHMDHLNRPSLRRIVRATRRQTGRAPVAIVPKDVADVLQGLGFSRVIELNWWEHTTIAGLTITHTPARHWGTRWFMDGHRGYGGFVIEGGAQSLYYSGDTAYFRGFAEIGARLRPDVALLPIGAYSPDVYRNVHTSPEDALRAFQDLGAKRMVPMHYGTFWLSQEPMDEPLPRLLKSAERLGLASRILPLEEGETAELTSDGAIHQSKDQASSKGRSGPRPCRGEIALPLSENAP